MPHICAENYQDEYSSSRPIFYTRTHSLDFDDDFGSDAIMDVPASSDPPTSSSPPRYILEAECRYYFDTGSSRSTVSLFDCSSRTSVSEHPEDPKSPQTDQLILYDDFVLELCTKLQKVIEERNAKMSKTTPDETQCGKMTRPTHQPSQVNDTCMHRLLRTLTRTMTLPATSRKRPRSFSTIDELSQSSQAAFDPELVNSSAKKPRLSLSRLPADRRPVRPVKKTATLKKGFTLRPEFSEDTQDLSIAEIVGLKLLATVSATPDPNVPPLPSNPNATDDDWVPTAPCTPHEPQPKSKNPFGGDIFRDPRLVLSPVKVVKNSVSLDKSTNTWERPIPEDVPVIAPPADHAWAPLLSEEAHAKLRLRMFREREANMREVDGLHGFVPATSDTQFSQDNTVDSEVPDSRSDLDVQRKLEGDPGRSFTDRLGYDMIEWILQVLPNPVGQKTTLKRRDLSRRPSPASTASSSTTTSTNTNTTSNSSSHSLSSNSTPRSHSKSNANLLDQLASSPETRFHAAYMFLRFFQIIIGLGRSDQTALFSPGAQGGINKYGDARDEDGFELVAWDVAVGCLALSVKMNRDVLPPLFPVYSRQFEALAPHDIGFADLETAQRDILLTLSYNLGSTPQAVLDELWIALPSLRELVGFHESSDGDHDDCRRVQGKECGCQGWGVTLEETWMILLDVVAEAQVLQFSLSLLTGAALAEGIILSLIRKYQVEEPWYSGFIVRRNLHATIRNPRVVKTVNASLKVSKYANVTERAWTALSRNHVGKAKLVSEGVILDIQNVLEVSEASFEECRKWIRERVSGSF